VIVARLKERVFTVKERDQGRDRKEAVRDDFSTGSLFTGLGVA
jgi:hypothetical protein